MTDNIPDDVVERALVAFESAEQEKLGYYHASSILAAGRVFVKWEREQIIEICEMIAGGNKHSDAMDVINAIRARSTEKE